MTPSQSKMNTSTSGNRSFDGWESFATLAFNDVLLLSILDETDAVRDMRGEKAPTRVVASVRAARALVYIVLVSVFSLFHTLTTEKICFIVVFYLARCAGRPAVGRREASER